VVSRASIQIEKLGLPSAPIVCTGFEKLGEETTKGYGVPGALPFVVYPAHVNAHTSAELIETAKTTITDQIVTALTVQPAEESLPAEWDIGQTMFKGTFDEVNEFFYKNGWSDGLPIVPPALEKVKAFLRYTDRDPADVIGVIKPDHRQATVWSIAVNGVMAGCRPEYLPVLIALVEAMADPKFFIENLGNTPGPETLIIINGPIIKDLEFNFLQGVTRTGFMANTSIGRFWRLFYRNVGGMLLHKTDKATFGGNFRIDNAVTIAACPSCQVMPQIPVASDTIERGLSQLAREVTSEVTWTYTMNYRGVSTRPIIVLSPQVAGPLAAAGYSKADLKKYFYDHTRRPAVDMPDAYDWVKKGLLPKEYGESTDPKRLIPITLSPDDFLIAVSGDPDRNNAMICDQNGVHGWPVSKRINLPSNWRDLLREAKAERASLLTRMKVIPLEYGN
jgi:hypothetical protein